MSQESTSDEIEDEEAQVESVLEIQNVKSSFLPWISEERLADSESNVVEQPGVSDDREINKAVQRIDSSLNDTVTVSLESKEITEEVEKLYDGDRLAAMRELLEEHHLRIVQQLLASDTGALSPKEVAFRNEEIISESTVRDHLRKLTEKGFMKKLEPDVERVPNEMPRTFYAASPFSIELLKEMGLWENLGMLYQIYDSLDRPEDVKKIEEWEGRPAPEWL